MKQIQSFGENRKTEKRMFDEGSKRSMHVYVVKTGFYQTKPKEKCIKTWTHWHHDESLICFNWFNWINNEIFNDCTKDNFSHSLMCAILSNNQDSVCRLKSGFGLLWIHTFLYTPTHNMYYIVLLGYCVSMVSIKQQCLHYCIFDNATWQDGFILVILEIGRPKFIFAWNKISNCAKKFNKASKLHGTVHLRFPFHFSSSFSLSYACKFENLLSECLWITNSWRFILFPQKTDPCAWYDFQFGHCQHAQTPFSTNFSLTNN